MKPRFWHLRTLTQKLSVYIGTAAGAVLMLTVLLNYVNRRATVDEETNASALDHVQTTAQNIDDYIDRVAMLPKTIAARQEVNGPEANGNTLPFLAHLLDSMPPEEAYGLYEAFDAKHYTDPGAMPWVDRKSLPNPVVRKYDYHDEEWFKGAKQEGKLFISEPYFDRGGASISMVSIAVPFNNAHGDFMGVAGVDVSLELIRLFASYLHLHSGDFTRRRRGLLVSGKPARQDHRPSGREADAAGGLSGRGRGRAAGWEVRGREAERRRDVPDGRSEPAPLLGDGVEERLEGGPECSGGCHPEARQRFGQADVFHRRLHAGR